VSISVPCKQRHRMTIYYKSQSCLKYFFRNCFVQAFFFIGIYFFYFICNNNCRLLTINIVSFIFFYYRESKTPFCLHYEKSSPVNIVHREINWQNPASISAYTQSEYRISNYVNHIWIIQRYTFHLHPAFIE
jgi:hypothetical protein